WTVSCHRERLFLAWKLGMACITIVSTCADATYSSIQATKRSCTRTQEVSMERDFPWADGLTLRATPFVVPAFAGGGFSRESKGVGALIPPPRLGAVEGED